MAGGDSRLFNLLSYAVGGGKADGTNEDGCRETLSDIHDLCFKLIQKDCECEVLKNTNGYLCSTYPENLIIPVSQREPRRIAKLLDCVLKGRFARTRGRFVVPALLVNGKYVCRSSTLARSPEIYCRRSYGYWVQGEPETNKESDAAEDSSGTERPGSNGIDHSHVDVAQNSVKSKEEEDGNGKEWLLDKMRNADINLLQFLQVDTIFDLMVENKKVKFGMNVTSSEKVDRQRRYLKFNLLSVPYPGCEFFAEYRKRDYCAEGLMFDWNQNFVDADLNVPKHINHLCDVTWDDYVNWDLVELTQNYLKLHLRSLMDGESKGILLHCISGWDRTPLFISLMRLSLWADGLIHQSLDVEEMVYFTVAYDWLLFSHKFSDRIANGEEIFYFCFDFLKYIYSDEYSMLSYVPKSDAVQVGPEAVSVKDDLDKGVESTKESCNHSALTLTQGDIEDNQNSHHSNGAHQNETEDTATETGGSLNGIIYSNWENSLASSNGSGYPIVGYHKDSSESVVEVPNSEAPAKLEVTSCDDVPPVAYSTFPNSCESSLKNGNGSSDKLPELVSNLCEIRGSREEKLRCARELLIENYQAAVQWQQDRQQASNSGFAATLLNQISSFVKR